MKKNKIFGLPIASNLGSALTETMKSVSQHEGGIKHGEINLPNFKEEVCTCTDECLGYLTKTCKRIEEPKKEPKQRLEKYSERFDNKENEVVDGIFNPENWGRRVVKQETLEEVAKKKYPMFKGETYIGNNKKMLRRAAFIKGAEWMKERMYSEEEVLEIIDLLFHQYASSFRIDAKEYFLQFKKK